MAIASRNKRAAAIMAGIPFIVITPIADGTIDVADRQHIAHVYPVLVASAAASVVYGMIRMVRTIRTILEPYGSM